jgi:Cu+-exporting ATPase
MSSAPTTDAGSTHEVDLAVTGMTCASCAHRIERKLNKLDGVRASVNYATEKAHVVFPAGLDTEVLLETVAQAGYAAELPRPQADDDAVSEREVAALRRRLLVAAALSVPVVALAMVPALQLSGWQWWSLVLATPVATWAAWPFHRAAVTNLRHGAVTMDTLVSMGVTAAYTWSVVALTVGDAGHLGMTHGFSWTAERGDGLSMIYLEVAAGVTTFLLAGRYAEKRAKRRAGAALRALLALSAAEATVLREGQEVRVTAEDLGVDELVGRPSGRADRRRRRRRVRRLRGRRLDAHRRAGARRREARRRGHRWLRQHLRPPGRAHHPGRLRHRPGPDGPAGRGGPAGQGGGPAARRPGLLGLRAGRRGARDAHRPRLAGGR